VKTWFKLDVEVKEREDERVDALLNLFKYDCLRHRSVLYVGTVWSQDLKVGVHCPENIEIVQAISKVQESGFTNIRHA